MLEMNRTQPVLVSMEKTMDALRSILIEMGEDYVYEARLLDLTPQGSLCGCRYFEKDGQPSCLVGHVLARQGMEPLPFKSRDNVKSVASLAFMNLIDFDDVSSDSSDRSRLMESRTLAFLGELQRAQDGGVSWGRAVQRALARYP